MSSMTSAQVGMAIRAAARKGDRARVYALTAYAEQESAYRVEGREAWGDVARLGRDALSFS